MDNNIHFTELLWKSSDAVLMIFVIWCLARNKYLINDSYYGFVINCWHFYPINCVYLIVYLDYSF